MGEPSLQILSARRVEMTVREYARYERVAERTVWRWIDKGAVSCRRTPGGGVRIIEHVDATRLTSTDILTATL